MEYPVIYRIELIYYPFLAAISIPVFFIHLWDVGITGSVSIYCSFRIALEKETKFIMETAQTSDKKQISSLKCADDVKCFSCLHGFEYSFVYVSEYSVAADCSVWFTVAFTFDRFVTICCQKLQSKYNTKKTASVVITTVFVVSSVKSSPFYFAGEPVFIIDNVPWYCVPTVDYLTSPLWRANICINRIITPLLPILLIVLFNALTIRHIIMANRVRRGLRSNSENQNDPEVKNRRKSMILLFTISANFILLWMTFVVYSINWPVRNYTYTDKYYSNPKYIVQQVGFMLLLLSSCTNTCIYGLTQRKFREELKNGIKYLFTLNGKLCQ
ncbi:probable G-protein coupled receptor 139 [Heterodontus francisci]|uniref:probable G-protein coupled receptor 139 n=1 Tax=Heterodontus francisci TaxID=7792 RepID=UPI00355B29D6